MTFFYVHHLYHLYPNSLLPIDKVLEQLWEGDGSWLPETAACLLVRYWSSFGEGGGSWVILSSCLPVGQLLKQMWGKG